MHPTPDGRRKTTSGWKHAWIGRALFLVPFALTSCSAPREAATIEDDFRVFLKDYVAHIESRDRSFLHTVNPELPEDMNDFFFDVTMNMMKHAKDEGLDPTVNCKEYGVCTVTWPLSDGSWAAQSFIRHDGKWQFLQTNPSP